jgi:hypothetical protein
MAVVNEWREPRYEEFQPQTVWGLLNAFTETLKGNLTLLPLLKHAQGEHRQN